LQRTVLAGLAAHNTGIIRRDEDSLQIDLQAEDDVLTRLHAATYRFALGLNKGKKALSLKAVPDTDFSATKGLEV
jgi:uncharacterized protein (UPF0303 family)